jgi:hypothetical protein
MFKSRSITCCKIHLHLYMKLGELTETQHGVQVRYEPLDCKLDVASLLALCPPST